jgi:hypothetical protein
VNSFPLLLKSMVAVSGDVGVLRQKVIIQLLRESAMPSQRVTDSLKDFIEHGVLTTDVEVETAELFQAASSKMLELDFKEALLKSVKAQLAEDLQEMMAKELKNMAAKMQKETLAQQSNNGVSKKVFITKSGWRQGDWICLGCSNHNWADKVNCNKCWRQPGLNAMNMRDEEGRGTPAKDAPEGHEAPTRHRPEANTEKKAPTDAKKAATEAKKQEQEPMTLIPLPILQTISDLEAKAMKDKKEVNKEPKEPPEKTKRIPV